MVAPPISGLTPATTAPPPRARAMACRTPVERQDRSDAHERIAWANRDQLRTRQCLDNARRGRCVLDALEPHSLDGDVGPPPHEVLLKVHPLPRLGQLDPRLDRLIGHGQDRDALDAESARQLRGHPRRRPAAREQLGTPQVRCQVQVAKLEPRLTTQPLERRHAPEGVAAIPPATRVVDHAGERVQHRVDVGRDAQAVQRDVVAGVDDRRQPRLGRRGAQPAREARAAYPS